MPSECYKLEEYFKWSFICSLIVLLNFFQFSTGEHFLHAKSLARELLDRYITDGIRLAWIMVTRIPPMIAAEPTTFDEHSTISEYFDDNDISLEPKIFLRPILYFSYEGEVAVQGIVSNPPSNFVSRDTGSAGDFCLLVFGVFFCLF